MATIAEIRQQYPQYSDLSDEQLGKALHGKYYSDMPYEEFVGKVGFAAPPQQRTLGQEARRQAGLMGRMAVDTVTALPLAALEGGAAVGNLASRAMGGEGNFSPRRTWETGMDAIFPKPETGLEKVTQFAGSALLGSRLPIPVPKGGVAPPGFQTAKELATETMANRVKSAQDLGYVIPPATSNPSATAKTLEGMAGKLSTAQIASARNMGVTERLASRALGLPEDAPLTLGAVRAVRSEAGAAYEAVRGAGAVELGPRWQAALDAAEAATKGANNSFPGLAKANPLTERIAALRQGSVDAGDAVDAIKVLREYADEAGASGAKHMAGTYRKLATELENRIDAHLSAGGPSNMVNAFREARQLIAKTYSVEKAMNKATGEVSAVKLGQQLGRGAPLSGDLKKAGEFALTFPKAARPFNESLPGISPLDFYAAGGTAALTGALTGGNPAALLPLAYPFARQGAREFLLSKAGQRLAVPSAGAPVSGAAVMGGVNGLVPWYYRDLLGQQ